MRSTCARKSWPRPAPSDAPSIKPGMSARMSWRSSASIVPSTGTNVVNGYAATFGCARVIVASSEDLPALGSPTRPTSASSLSCSSTMPSSPGSPRSASRGACRVAVANVLLPRPPGPPLASVTSCPGRTRSNVRPSQRSTVVPGGTGMTSRSPSAPCMSLPMPCPPRSALKRPRRRKDCRSRRESSQRSSTSPPRPPSPPSGPPLGTRDSRRNDIEPSPPRPASTSIRARSASISRGNDRSHGQSHGDRGRFERDRGRHGPPGGARPGTASCSARARRTSCGNWPTRRAGSRSGATSPSTRKWRRSPERALDEYGQIDVVFANAGVGHPRGFEAGDPDDAKQMVITNVFGIYADHPGHRQSAAETRRATS